MNGQRECRVIASSVRGGSHERIGLPNQDAVAVRAAPGRSSAIVALSDGHGSRRSFRSDVGAQLAVEIACNEAEAALASIETDAAARDETIDQLVRRVVDRWRERVVDHLEHHAVADDELDGVDGGRPEHENDPLRAYGATMLIAIVADDAVVIVQLGDGDVVLRTSDEQVIRPIEHDAMLVAGETTSLCLSDAQRFARRTVIDRSTVDVSLVLMATDGYGNAFEDPSWHADVTRDFAEHVREHGIDWIEERLPNWLAESARIGGDDVTLALAFLSSLPIAPAAAPLTAEAAAILSVDTLPPNAPTAEAASPSTSPQGAKNRRRAIVFGLIAAALALALGGAAWAAAGHDAVTPATTPAASTPTSARLGAPIGVTAAATSPSTRSTTTTTTTPPPTSAAPATGAPVIVPPPSAAPPSGNTTATPVTKRATSTTKPRVTTTTKKRGTTTTAVVQNGP